jgi:MFS family permease
LLLSAGLTALLIAITRVGQGVLWNAPSTLLLAGVATAILSACLWHERSAPEPILPLALFKIRTMALCCGVVFIAFFQLIPLVVLMPLRLEMFAGINPGAVGLRLVPLTLGIPIGAYTAGTLMARTGRYKPWQLIGAVLVPTAVFAIASAGSRDLTWIAAFMALTGFSIGLQLPTALVAAQNAIPVQNLGVGTASIAFFRTLGGAVGVAVISAILLTLLREHVANLLTATPTGENLRELILRALNAADAATRDQLLQIADHAFRTVLYISASLSMISVGLIALMPEKPLRLVASAPQPMDSRI